MSLEWKIKSIDDISSVKGGKRIPKGHKLQLTPTAHPYITVSDFNDDGSVDASKLKYINEEIFQQIKQYTISSADLYISIAGTIGKTGYVSKELEGANLTENACKLVFHDGVYKEFVYYFTKSNSFIEQTGVNTRVAAQPKLALSRLKTILIPIPPFPEQKRIVAILDEAFAGISLAVANAEKNLANARELFESYLNNFFTQKGDATLVKLSDITTDITDGDHSAPPKAPDGIPFITISNVNKKTRLIDFTNTFKVPEEYFNSLKLNRKPQYGDVLYTVTGSYGIPIKVPKDVDFCFQRHIGLLRPNEETNTSWLHYALLSPAVFKQATDGATGTAQKTVSLRVLRSIRVPLISIHKQEIVVIKLDNLWGKTQQLETIYQQKLTALNELKQSILQKAFTGELTQKGEIA